MINKFINFLIIFKRNLLKFFAFFDLDKIIKIFTALLLERHILIVSKDLENLTSCALSLEYLIYPLEWFHMFAPIMPEHIDIHVFYQPFPFIYGIHTCIYEKLTQSQLDECVILQVDERQVINGDKVFNLFQETIQEFAILCSNYSRISCPIMLSIICIGNLNFSKRMNAITYRTAIVLMWTNMIGC